MAFATINKGSSYFDATLYSGNDGTQSITSLNFKPDFLWIKSRNTAVNHQLIDVIRGTGKQLSSNDTAAEASPTYPYISTFDTNGWTMTNGSLSGGNTTGRTYVGWSWLGGGTGVSNTQGSITSTVSANTTSGFSVVSYTGNGTSGATVGHGLGAVPKFIIYKERSQARNWYVFTSVIDGSYDNLYLNNTDAKTDRTITLPTSSVFSLSSSNEHNENNETYIAYCFADVKGYSKFGSYVGNGNANGTFVYTGFRPAWLLIKESSAAGAQWYLYDNKTAPFNLVNENLFPNLTNVTNSGNNQVDFYSNGFKMRSSNTDTNNSGNTYIYMAFAENPFVLTDGTPVTAR